MKRLVLCVFLAAMSLSGEPKLLFQKPTLSATEISFVYAGDLWVVGRNGGVAQRLTSGAGIETRPYFSPDGTEIAFTGQYDGNVDIFVMPAAGGVPRRLTWHPGVDLTMGWTPDGKSILFASSRNTIRRATRNCSRSRAPEGSPPNCHCPWLAKVPTLPMARASPTFR